MARKHETSWKDVAAGMGLVAATLGGAGAEARKPDVDPDAIYETQEEEKDPDAAYEDEGATVDAETEIKTASDAVATDTSDIAEEGAAREETFTVQEAEEVFGDNDPENIDAMEQAREEMTFKVEEEDPDKFLTELAFRTISKRRFHGQEPFYPFIDDNEEYRKRIFGLVKEKVEEYNKGAAKKGLEKIDPYNILGIIAEESGFNSKVKDGLMQVVPASIKKPYKGITKRKRMSMEENIERGIGIFAYQLNLFKDPEIALLSYGTGHGAMIRSFCEKYEAELKQYGINVREGGTHYGFPEGGRELYNLWLSEGKISLAEMYTRFRKMYGEDKPGYHYLIPKMMIMLAEDLRKKYTLDGDKKEPAGDDNSAKKS